MRINTMFGRTALLVMLANVLWLPNAFGQQCGGAMGIAITPNTFPPNQMEFTGSPMGQVVQVTLQPGASANSQPLTLDHVDYALACFDNGDEVPCGNGNDTGLNSGEIPIEFGSFLGGSCNIANVNQGALGAGTISFEFVEPVTFNPGESCSVSFTLVVQDRGTDNSPLTLTGATRAAGTCGPNLQGGAAGSVAVFLRTEPGISLKKEISIDGGNTWFDANDPSDTPWAAYPSGAEYRLTVKNTGLAVLNNVTVNDPALGIVNFSIGSLGIDQEVVIGAGDIAALSQDLVCDTGGNFENVASVAAVSADDGQEVGDIDPANLFCVGIDVKKSADDLGKIGDSVDYTISLINDNGVALQNCEAVDPLLGGTIFGPGAALAANSTEVLNLVRPAQIGDPDPLVNEVALNCDAVGPVNTVALSDFDDAETNLFQPSVSVAKTGPALAKAGDTVTYTVTLTDTSSGDTPDAISCTATDLMTNGGNPFAIGFGQTQYTYPIPADVAGPIDNEVTVECQVDGFTNVFGDSDSHSIDLFTAGVSVVKTGPSVAKAGDTVEYTVTLANNSSEDAPALTCTAEDPLKDSGAPFSLGFGESNAVSYSATIPGDAAGTFVNTVDVSCDVAGFDNEVTASDSHTIDLFTAGVTVDKTGPATAKAGDTVTYTVNLGNTSSDNAPALTCEATDPLTNGGAAFAIGFGETTYDYTIPTDATGPIVNTVTVDCDVDGFDNEVTASDSHSLDLFTTGISVDKTGPELAKAGDTVTYTVSLSNEGSLDDSALNCTATDPLKDDGAPFAIGFDATMSYDYAIPGDATGPVVNTVTVNCDVDGFDNEVTASDSHSIDLFTADISVDKTGPDTAKAGDTVTYTVTLTNASSGNAPVLTCNATDPLTNDGQPFAIGFGDTTYDYPIPTDATGPIDNTVTVDCDVDGFDNAVTASDSHSIDLINPSVTLAKACSPDPVQVGGTIEWTIEVTNDGDAELDCLVNDATAGIVDSPLLLAAGASDSLIRSRIVESGDFPSISNTASVSCAVAGFDNRVDAEDTADCEVQQDQGEEICRTPGFWSTHAGTEKRRSSNLAQTVIDAAGGSLSICGQTIDNTSVGNVNSAVEAMCVTVRGQLERQLARQLTAMALNCVVSGGTADCTGTSVEGLFADANAACTIGGGGPQLGPWIDRVDCFNNGGQFDEATESCSVDPANNCQNRELDESTDIFDGISPLPGPAGSPRACSSARNNGVKVVPAF